MTPRELTDAEVAHADRHGWRVSRMGAESNPRPQMTAHLYTAAEMTACGQPKVMAATRSAIDRDIACSDCMDAVDPAGSAALMPDEFPLA